MQKTVNSKGIAHSGAKLRGLSLGRKFNGKQECFIGKDDDVQPCHPEHAEGSMLYFSLGVTFKHRSLGKLGMTKRVSAGNREHCNLKYFQ